MSDTVAGRVEQVGDSLFHNRDGETISITPWGPDGLRVRVTAGGTIIDTAWALTEKVAPSESKITINDAEATIRNGKISTSISDIKTQPGYLQFFATQETVKKPASSVSMTMSPPRTTRERAFSSLGMTASFTRKRTLRRRMGKGYTVWG